VEELGGRALKRDEVRAAPEVAQEFPSGSKALITDWATSAPGIEA